MSASKTARASQVKDRTVKSVIPDADLIRSLRIDRESGLYPGVQGTDALLRAYDDLFLESAFQHTEYQNAINVKNDRIKILEDGAAEQQEKITRLTTRLQQLDDERDTYKAAQANAEVAKAEAEDRLQAAAEEEAGEDI